MSFASVPELVAEIRAGRMIVLLDDEDRENEGDLVMAAECVRPEDVNFMAREARGLICLTLSAERCRRLRLEPMVGDNRSPHRTAFTVSIEAAEGVTTGISAFDRAHTIRTAVRADARPEDLSQPGHVFPLTAQPGGVLVRAGHTEAACDLAALAGFEPAGVICEVMDDDGRMARRPQLEAFAARHGLKIGCIADLIRHRFEHEHTIERIDTRAVETVAGAFTLATYRSRLDGAVHFALSRGLAAEVVPLVRVHVEEPLADVLGVVLPQARPAHRELEAIAAVDAGVLVVLTRPREPARWLAAFERPTPEDGGDWRLIGTGAQILADLGLRRIRVLGTPRRFRGLSGFGLEVLEYAPLSAP